jgi:hypothetical protein
MAGALRPEPHLQAAELRFEKDFRYGGGYVINLYGTAEGEQHLFVSDGSSGVVRRFYCV